MLFGSAKPSTTGKSSSKKSEHDQSSKNLTHLHRPSDLTVVQEQKQRGTGNMVIQDHTARDQASNRETASEFNRDSTFKKKYRPTEMNFGDMQMSIHEQDEAHEILSEMRDHVGEIEDDSEV